MIGLRSSRFFRGPRTFAGWALLFVGAFVLAGAAAALAYWTVSVNNGSGSYAVAQANSLSAPTTPTATPNGGGAITVGWTLPGSQLPGAQYQVTRTSPGSPTTVCTVAATATSCQDTGLTSNTLYGYSISAVLDNWQSSAITTSATTATPNFVITLSSGPYTAGTSATVQTMQAMIGASVDTTYSGAKTITWSGLPNSPSNQAPSYPSSAVTFTNGVANPSSAFTAYAAGSNTLTATDASATAVTGSTSFTVAAGGANSMVFTTQTTGAAATATTVFPVQPVVTVEDLYGNTAVSYASAVGLTISAGQTLGCTSTSVTPTAGVATFAGCHGNTYATGITLTASSTGLSNVTSASFSISKAANKLAFTTQPSTPTTAGSAFGTQPVVSVEDTNGRIVTADSTTQVQLTAGGGTGTLTCTNQAPTVTLGVAAFANCSINKSGTTYTLTAAATGLTSATSNTLTITAGTATQLVFSTQPGGGANGATWGTQPVVTVEDSLGNTVTTSTASVTLSINTQPGTGATLSCTTNPLTATSGVASLAGCDISGKAGTYTLTAAATGLTSATSNNLTISVGTASQLAFTTQPGGGGSGATWGTQPVVTVEDSGGNTVTTSAASVTLSINTQPGTGATLSCTTNPKTAASGVASFAGCMITGKAGTYTLTAAATGLTSATSNNLTITFGTATQLVFTTQPGGGGSGATWGTQPVVTVEDSGGNTVTTSAASVTLSINTQPGSGATLSCTTNPLTATSGVASLAGCDISGKAGTYTLTAAATGLTSATSNNLTISVGTASQLAFTTQPGGGGSGATWGTQPVVTVEDSGGNTVTTSAASVTLSINTQPGTGATLSCTTNPKTAASGVASFAGCMITGKAGTYTLTAAATGLTSATSNNLTITFGTATQLVFTTQPGGGGSGATWGTQPVVTVEDSGGNTVTTSAASVTLSINTQPGTGATLSCTTNPKAAASGVASFAGCKITGTAGTYTLAAKATGLTTAISNSFSD